MEQLSNLIFCEAVVQGSLFVYSPFIVIQSATSGES